MAEQKPHKKTVQPKTQTSLNCEACLLFFTSFLYMRACVSIFSLARFAFLVYPPEEETFIEFIARGRGQRGQTNERSQSPARHLLGAGSFSRVIELRRVMCLLP